MNERIVLKVTVEFVGDQAQQAIAQVDRILPNQDGVIAGSFAGVIKRQLVTMGMVGGWPNGWDTAHVLVEVQPWARSSHL